MKRKILVGISDTHGGHKLGLCNPKTILENVDNGAVTPYSPQISEIQNFMWETYEWGIQETLSLAGKDDIVVIHDGDPTHGKAGFLQVMSNQISDQILIAVANFEPWFKYKNVKTVRFALGTGIHEFGEGSSSTIIANLLRSKYPKVDVGMVYHGLLNIDGFLIDYSHHGPFTGSRKWLEGNELRYYLRSIMMDELMNRNTPPSLVIRGHYHTYRREFLEIIANGVFYEGWAVVMPGFTFKDDYTRKASRSEFKQTIGMLAFEIIDGHLYRVHPFIKTIDIRTKEII